MDIFSAQKQVTCTVNATDPQQTQDIYVALNGYAREFKQGVEVTIPEAHYKILAECKNQVHEQKENGVTTRLVPAYNINVSHYETDAELKKRIGGVETPTTFAPVTEEAEETEA